MRRRALLLWFGVLGAPAAWAVQHVTGYALTEAACHEAATRWTVAVDTWTIVVTAAAATIAVLAGLAAVATWRATRDAEIEGAPPEGRMHFMSVMGMTLTPLFLMIILMSGLGSIFIAGCVA